LFLVFWFGFLRAFLRFWGFFALGFLILFFGFVLVLV